MSAHPPPSRTRAGSLYRLGGVNERAPPALEDEASEPFQTRRRRQAHTIALSKAPSPRLGGVNERAPPALEDEGSEPFQTRRRRQAHTIALSKAPSPRLGGVDKRAQPPSGTRARSLYRLGGVVKHTLSPFQKLPAPVSGASTNVHSRSRGRGLGAFSDSASSSSTHYRPFKSSQPPSRGR